MTNQQIFANINSIRRELGLPALTKGHRTRSLLLHLQFTISELHNAWKRNPSHIKLMSAAYIAAHFKISFGEAETFFNHIHK